MEHVQVGRTRTHDSDRLRDHLVLIPLCLLVLVPLAKAEKRVIKELNAQLGRTAAEVEVQPVWGVEGLTGAKIGWATEATKCLPMRTERTNWAGWTVCVVYINSIPQFTPGMVAYNESHTTSTTTGGDRTMTTPVGVGPDGRVYGGDTITLKGPPLQTNSTTVTVEHPGTPSWAYYRDLAIYFFFGGDRTSATGWQAYVRTRDAIGPSQWTYVDSWEARVDSHGRIKPVRSNPKKHLEFWFIR
jgi:hypothetical protein